MTILYTIGEVSRFLKISSKTLRHYDKLNLLKPSYIDPDTNYRYYQYDQFFNIDVIRYLNKTLYIPLEDIKKMLDGDKNNGNLFTFLEMHREKLNEKIAELEYSRQLTDSLIADLESKGKFYGKNRVFEQFLMSRNLYYIELDTSIFDIDKYVIRRINSYTNIDNKENNNMCLLFSLSEFKKTNNLNVKGFGIFSDKKIPGMKTKIIREGRYYTQHFLYSEQNTMNILRNIMKYAHLHSTKVDDTALLISKMVDLSARSKYDYFMELQVVNYI